MNDAKQATPPDELERQICNSTVPKNEREWWAYHEIERLRARITELEAELERVKRAAINGMNAATAHGHGLVEQAARLRAESNPDALESERAMNAALTEQLERAELATLRAERDALRAAGEAALRTLDNVRVFVTSRERIHKPSGEEWFEGCVKALRAALEER